MTLLIKCLTLQADSTTIGIVHDHMVRLLRKFMLKFVKSAVISQHSIITEVPYSDRKNQHDDDYVALGKECRSYISDHEDEVSPATVSKFIRYVHFLFYCLY